VRELCAIEIEADGLLRTVSTTCDPYESSIPVDESLNKPGAGEAIDPWVLAGRPHSLLILGVIDRSDLPL
jgi:hypothetical protein